MKNQREFPNEGFGIATVLGRTQKRPGLLFGLIILVALAAFEMFNFSTTDFALKDLLGDLRFAGIQWATILAIAFCGIDFAGIARLFTPSQDGSEQKEAWYLFGAWFLAATMNAVLSWWGVSLAISNHNLNSSSVIDPGTLTRIIPVFVALMVWVIRILIIGSLSIAGEQLFGGQRSTINGRPLPNRPRSYTNRPSVPVVQAVPAERPRPGTQATRQPAGLRSSSRPVPGEETASIPEPTYHGLNRPANRPAVRASGSDSHHSQQL